MSAKPTIEKIINDAKPVRAEQWQIHLVDIVMGAALAHAKAGRQPLGSCFAAAFDLIVAAHYYGNVANKGWIYCGPQRPVLLYPYTNTCPRCAIRNKFHFHKANKPRSGNIGSVTSSYLCLCYQWFFRHSDFPDLEIMIGKEPVDVLLLDRKRKNCFLAEIKASPLVIFPLAVQSDQLTEEDEGGRRPADAHEEVTISRIAEVDLHMLLPSTGSASALVKLGRRACEGEGHWAANAISNLCKNSAFFETFFKAWSDAFSKYSGKVVRSGSFWLTNSCGTPNPMPASWPRRSNGSGYETISDNKTSVGMDRTDDIKKGTYQVLKIGSVAKFPKQANWQITVGLVSNIHAVQHFSDYLASIADVVWTKTASKAVKRAADLPPDADIANLFDGIVSFTSSTIRDEWLKKIFSFESAK
jgi:hypothetical protein